jgi:hypothetical protein
VSYEEPIRELRLSFLWESLSEELINDSPFHSDLDPLTAPVWLLELRTEEKLNSSLWSYLQTLQEMAGRSQSDTSPLLNRLQEKSEESESEVRSVLDKLSGQTPLTLTLPSFQSYLPRIPEPVVKFLVSLIFSPEDERSVPEPDHFLKELKWIKSCKFDNLTWRMVHVISFVSASTSDGDSIVLLWRDLIHELRQNWESGHLLPG